MLLSLIILCFTLSGFAALLYQTAWIRLFAIAFGTSEVAIAVVLAGYMGGLAVGAALAARYVAVIRRPVLVYGLLEGGIAIAALAMPLMVIASGQLYAFFVGGQPAPPDAGSFGQPLYYSIASLLVLLVPTVLMGATLPLLAQFVVTSNRNLGGRVSLLYSMNTFGAVAGVLAAGFILLPEFGLRGTVCLHGPYRCPATSAPSDARRARAASRKGSARIFSLAVVSSSPSAKKKTRRGSL